MSAPPRDLELDDKFDVTEGALENLCLDYSSYLRVPERAQAEVTKIVPFCFSLVANDGETKHVLPDTSVIDTVR